MQGKYDEADPLYLRAIEIGEKTLGPDHPDLATRLNNRARLLESQVRAVRKFQIIFVGIRVSVHRGFLGGPLPHSIPLLVMQGKYEEAGPLYDRSLAIREKVFGPDHPAVATALNNRAVLLYKQVIAIIFSREILVVLCGAQQPGE